MRKHKLPQGGLHEALNQESSVRAALSGIGWKLMPNTSSGSQWHRRQMNSCDGNPRDVGTKQLHD